MKTPLVAVAVASLFVGCAAPPRHTRSWEYKTVSGHVIGRDDRLDAAINQEISQGWQFVSAGQAADQWGFAVLRRERIGLVAFRSTVPLHGANASNGRTLDVPNMQHIPPGQYELKLQLEGKDYTAKLAITNDRAVFLQSSTDELEGLSGQFESIGNGVFMARLGGRNFSKTEWWYFRPDGTASIKEVPDRGEKETATPIRDK